MKDEEALNWTSKKKRWKMMLEQKPIYQTLLMLLMLRVKARQMESPSATQFLYFFGVPESPSHYLFLFFFFCFSVYVIVVVAYTHECCTHAITRYTHIGGSDFKTDWSCWKQERGSSLNLPTVSGPRITCNNSFITSSFLVKIDDFHLRHFFVLPLYTAFEEMFAVFITYGSRRNPL